MPSIVSILREKRVEYAESLTLRSKNRTFLFLESEHQNSLRLIHFFIETHFYYGEIHIRLTSF